MPGATTDLVDHSPYHPSAAAPIPTASNVILIDNYDSFTWNVYQYLILEGANVTVYRNDEIPLPQLISLNPTQLVISPGPGHPDTDAGVSQDAIKHFAGHIPVLGVCMGEQCIFSAFGGNVDVTGEILHGKTSLLRHDGKGMYAGLPQKLPVTRYHSLAGTHGTLPGCLEVSSWVEKQDVKLPDGGGQGMSDGVIMGVRHREFTVEGCQFHPESILTEEGRVMLKNFLQLRGGTWKGSGGVDQLSNGSSPDKSTSASNGLTNSSGSKQSSSAGKTSILEKIFSRRREKVEEQMRLPSLRPLDLQRQYDRCLAPPQISFPNRLKQSDFALSLMAEIKRASPSKGIIASEVDVPAQAREYALAGASVISVLTEPEFFLGSIEDLRAVRQTLAGMPNRPAVLRKEFIFNKYQILEARLAGADTVLLIVKMLEESLLKQLYQYSQSLGMEPLVEVNDPEEMQRAARLGAKVIGVNNRNLATFDVDLETTSRLMEAAPQDSVVCALSGIFGPQDVAPYQKNGVGAVLVGEALMRAPDTAKFVSELLGGARHQEPGDSSSQMLVKICGTRRPEAAKTAIEAGADLVGIILVEGRTRFARHEIALEISQTVHNTPKPAANAGRSVDAHASAQDYGNHSRHHLLNSEQRALLVGVFRNQPLSYILERQRALQLDIVQLHGDEPIEWADLIPVPVIHSFKPDALGIGTRGYHAAALLDAGAGGSGETLDADAVKRLLEKDAGLRVLLAGGLDPSNLSDQLQKLGSSRNQVQGVDVSSGVETNGQQDLEKIRSFVQVAKMLKPA